MLPSYKLREGLVAQLERNRTYICVRKHLDNSISAWYKSKALCIEHILQRSLKEPKQKVETLSSIECSKLGKQRSPWSKFNPEWLRDKNVTYKKIQNVVKID
jgi:hypothetical protein